VIVVKTSSFQVLINAVQAISTTQRDMTTHKPKKQLNLTLKATFQSNFSFEFTLRINFSSPNPEKISHFSIIFITWLSPSKSYSLKIKTINHCKADTAYEAAQSHLTKNEHMIQKLIKSFSIFLTQRSSKTTPPTNFSLRILFRSSSFFTNNQLSLQTN